MITPKGFWELAKNLPTLLAHQVGILFDSKVENDDVIDQGFSDLSDAANLAGIPAMGCVSVQIPDGINPTFSFIDRTATAITGFLPNSESVFVVPTGSTSGGYKIAGVHYTANALTGQITFNVPFLPVTGDQVFMNCLTPSGISIASMESIVEDKWINPYYEEPEV